MNIVRILMAATKVRGMQRDRTVRSFAKRGDAARVPNLWEVQSGGYVRFLQEEKPADQRNPNMGLESLLREIFPIESYDGTMHLEYVSYELDEPRYTPDECRELRLTYGLPFKLRLRLKRETHGDLPEEDIYLGEFPIMMGGGEFIVNGAERVIVSQLHRSPAWTSPLCPARATARCTRPASSPSAARGSSWR
jgi:DNA-directed RNA polymerase subunit beta